MAKASDQTSTPVGNEGEKLIAVFIKGLNEAAIGVNINEEIEVINPGAEALLGFSSGELFRQPLAKILPGIQTAGEYPGLMEIQARRKNGSAFPARVSYTGFDAAGRISGVLILREITPNIQEDGEGQTSRAKLIAALESMTDAVFIADAAGNLVDFNKAFAAFHRFNSKSDCPRTLEEYASILDLYMDNGELAPMEMWAIPRALRGEVGVNVEYGLKQRNSGEAWAGSYSFSPIRDAGGSVTGCVVVCRDITEYKKAEVKIREEDGIFRSVFESANVGKSITLGSGIISVNQAFEAMLGYEGGELDNKHWKDITPAEDIPKIEEIFHKLISGEMDSTRTERRYFRKDGSTLWADMNVTAARDTNGRFLYFINTVVDISKQKRVLQRLNESEERFRSIVERSPDGFFIQIDRKFAFLNPAACRLFGIKNPEELLGSLVIEHIHPDDQNIVRERIRRLNEDRESVSDLHEIRFLRLDGSFIWVETSGEPIQLDGKTGALVVVRDISKRKEVEKAREEADARFRLLAESAPIGIVITDQAHNIYYVSPRFVEIFGYTLEDVPTAEAWYRLAYPDPDYRAEVVDVWRTAIRKAAETGTGIKPHVFRVQRKGGGIRQVEFRMKSAEGLNFVVLTDVTDRVAAETETRRQKEILQLFIEHSPASIAMFDTDMRYIAVSRRFLEDYGISNQEVVGKTHYEVFPEIPERWKAIHRRCLAGVVESCAEDPFPRASGKIDWVRWEIRPWYESGGEIGGLVLFSEVITFRKIMEDALRSSEEKFSLLFDKTPIPAALSRFSDLTLVDVNQAWLNLFGFQKNEVVGKTSIELGILRDIPVRKESISEVERQKTVREIEMPFFDRNGKPLTVLVNADLVKIGGEDFSLATLLDITERKQVEIALQRYNERLKNLHAIDQAILQAILSAESIARSAIPALSSLVGSRRAAIGILDRQAMEIHAIEQDTLTSEFRSSRNPVTGETLKKMEMAALEGRQMILRENDSQAAALIPLILRIENCESFLIIPLLAEETPVGFLCVGWEGRHILSAEEIEIADEVSSQIAIALHQSNLRARLAGYAADLEARVAERTAQLEATNRDLEAFAYSVSHDLRAPLRGIQGFSQILVEDYGQTLDDEGRRLLGIITGSTQKMDRLIIDLLELSRTTRMELNLDMINMTEMAKAVFEEAASACEAKPTFRLACLPEACADPILIRQVWANLLSNAVKYSRTKPDCRVEVSGEVSEGECIYTVRDNGVGFDDAHKQNLFDVFKRLHKDSEFEGTGVGLAIVQRIIQRHGGRVWAEGKVDEGAAFHFSLPEKRANGAA